MFQSSRVEPITHHREELWHQEQVLDSFIASAFGKQKEMNDSAQLTLSSSILFRTPAHGMEFSQST